MVSVLKSALNFLEGFSNRFRINFIFSDSLLEASLDNKDFSRLEIESGGLIYFNDLNKQYWKLVQGKELKD